MKTRLSRIRSARAVVLGLGLAASLGGGAPAWAQVPRSAPPLVPLEEVEPPPPQEGQPAFDARADQPPPSEEPPKASYGWAFLLTDGLSLSAVTVGLITQRTDVVIAGGVGYVLAGPFVHLMHGQLERAGMSLMGRIFGPPVIAFGIASQVCSAAVRDCGTVLAVSFAIGVACMTFYDVEHAELPLRLEPSIGSTARGTPTFGFGARF